MLRKRQLFLLVLAGLFVSGCATAPYRPSIVLPPGGIYHIVAGGQTLYSISKAYGVDIRELMRLNNIKDPNQIGVGERLFIPRIAAPAVENLVGEKQYRVRWKTITLHHSGTKEGNAAAFDRNHRQRHMGGLFYHFVIGNGTDSGDGEIEVGWRWRNQAEANRRQDIQICLVGDFNKQEVSYAQFNSLLQLLRVLKRQYSIPVSRIRTHKYIPGRITECPGRHFPLSRIIAELRKA